jgi:hypothetical protein
VKYILQVLSAIRDFLWRATANRVSVVGVALATLGAISFLAILALEVGGVPIGNYAGIFSYLILPAIFVVGLVLIPIGMRLQRKKEQKTGQPSRFPVLDFNNPRLRSVALLVMVLTVVNLMIVSAATFKGVEVMDSTQFCGGTCHTVMTPEFTTYQRSPHSRVKCTECHIGSGADWFAKSKLSGSWQLVSVALDLYPRPIPVPVENLRPARETCEQCHWPTRFVGERLRFFNRFAEDEKQTEKKTVLLMKTGGGETGRAHGIHWHVDPDLTIRYRSDKSRQKIFDIELTRANGKPEVYKLDGAKPDEAEPGWRVMDCVDCHNRPTHVYQMPKDELDTVLTSGELDKSLPFIKREGLKAVQQTYTSHADAKEGIHKALTEFYRTNSPDLLEKHADRIDRAADTLTRVYARNVFPEMRIAWGTYPNFLKHEPGCFRCHDNEHRNEQGKKISRSCSLCHEVLAVEEEHPEILEVLHP